MKKILVMILGLMLIIGSVAAEGEKAASSDVAIVEEIVENMKLIAQVPRPSHHEEKISAFFMDWAKKEGFEPVQDEALNVMFDVPATEGLENLPMVILQVHMDMVVAVEDGKKFDPLNDPITVIWNTDDNTLIADGTSLGADDGAGCAFVMAAAKGKMDHGPLRVIITTDEEDGMYGSLNMDASWLENVGYLINLDYEVSNEVLVSTAAGDEVRASASPAFQEAEGDLALTVKLAGLLGGHSGVEIDKGRLNGIIGLAGFLKELSDRGIGFELASFTGGTASNAIPSQAECVIVVASQDRDAVEKAAAEYCDGLRDKYAGIEQDLSLSVTEANGTYPVVSHEMAEHIIRYLTGIIDGVFTMSADMEGLVESSSNLGICVLNAEGFYALSYLRSSVGSLQEEIRNAQVELAEACGMEANTSMRALPWAYNPDSRLLALIKKVYREQNGEDINVVAVHAGLECGTYKVMNPTLDMISIGPDLKDVHTTRETFCLDTVPKVWHLIEGLLTGIGE